MMNAGKDSLLGKRVDEYVVQELLGAGGMARVYRALDSRLNRYVALKVIAPDFRTDADYAMRFEREAQSIARLEHPNIVRIYRFGESKVGQGKGLYYMAMEYIQGADVGWLIDEYRKSGEVMSLANAGRVLKDIGEALDYAHAKQVIHRDVKPGNIIVDNQGRAVLTDFGLVLLSDVGTQGEIFGSPHYISPEQAVSSSGVVPQSDLYSLGVTLFEMLTGELPFSGSDPMDIAMRHLTEPPPLPSQFNAALPPAVDHVVLKALQKEPADRFSSGADFSAAFQQAIGSRQATRPGGVSAARRQSQVAVPDKVRELMASVPLPPLPGPIPVPADILEPSFLGSGSTVTRKSPLGDLTQPARYVRPEDGSEEAVSPAISVANDRGSFAVSRLLIVPAGFVVLVCLIGALYFAGSRLLGQTASTLPAAAPSATSVVLVSSMTQAPSATSTVLPTDLPTPTPVVLAATAVSFGVTSSASPGMVITPSLKTLVFRGTRDWVALVNVADSSLSLDNLRLQQDTGSLTGADWGKSTLLPGECLRIYRNNAPKELPRDCSQPFDLTSSDRNHWLDDKTIVFVNSSTHYCYPSKLCN
jgi:serine/threonine protein kinase